MGNKFCSNCDKVCPYNNNNIIQTNLSRDQISNKIPEDNFILSILTSQKNNTEKNEIDKRINEIMILNNVRKIIKAYKEHLNKMDLTERENFSNSNDNNYIKYSIKNSQNQNQKTIEINTELNSRNSIDKMEEYKKDFNDNLSYNLNDKHFLNFQIEKKTDFINLNIPKIQCNNLLNEKEGSTLSASISKEEGNDNKTGRKSSFLNSEKNNFIDLMNKNNDLKSFTFSNSSSIDDRIKSKAFRKSSRLEKGRNIKINLNQITNETFDTTIKNNSYGNKIKNVYN